MRKIMTFIIAGVLMLSMVGCGNNGSSNTDSGKNSTVAKAVPEEGMDLYAGLYYAGDDIPVGKYTVIFEHKEDGTSTPTTRLYEDLEHYKSSDTLDFHWFAKEGESTYINLKENYILEIQGQQKLKLYPQK